jgi:hypothetical protein
MRTSTKLTLLGAVAALALMSVVGLGSAAATGHTQVVSGNFIDTAIDTNEDGMQANYWSGAVRGGPTYEGLVEVAFKPTGLCDPGEVEGEAVAYSVVRRHNNGDLQYSRLVDGILCFDPGAGTADLTINAEYFGGTGIYADASGTYTATFTIRGLVPDPTGGIGHGAFSGTTSGSG